MKAPWTVRIERLPTELAVGVHAHEQALQPVQVSVVIKGRAAAHPDGLGDCLDYEPLLDWLTRQWPASPHVALLESRLNELFEYCFALDVRIDSVWAGLYKPTLCRGAAAVGMERGLTRREYAAQKRPLPLSALTAPAGNHHASH